MRYCFIPASCRHFASVGSLRKLSVIEPLTVLFFPPSEASSMMLDAPETALFTISGRQLSRFAKT